MAKTCTSRRVVRIPDARRTIPPMKTSVCSWPLTRPAARPSATSAMAVVIAPSSPFASMISAPARSHPMAAASFAICAASPTSNGRASPAATASRAVSSVAVPVALTKAIGRGAVPAASARKSSGHAAGGVRKKALLFLSDRLAAIGTETFPRNGCHYYSKPPVFNNVCIGV